MRILIVNDHFGKSGGAETFVHGLRKALIKKGHTVGIFGSKEGEDFMSWFSRWYSEKWYRRLQNVISSFNPDIVHINNCQRVLSPSVIDASLDLGISTIMTFHDFGWLCYRMGGTTSGNFLSGHKCYFKECLGYQEDFTKLWKKRKLDWHRTIIKSKPISFVAPSNILARNMQNFLRVPIKLIKNGIEIPKKSTKYQNIILYVGELNEAKGFEKFAGLLDEIKGYEIIVFGDGQLKQKLQEEYKNIKFLGFQNPKEYYKKASILIMPSLWMENCSYSVLEAMSYGLCVVASDMGGLPEQIEDNQTGIIFSHGERSEFIAKLGSILKDKKKLIKIGKRAREYVKKINSWDIIARQYEELYKDRIETDLAYRRLDYR